MSFRAVFDALFTKLYFTSVPHHGEKTVSTQRSLDVHTRPVPPFVDSRPFTSEHGISGVVALVEKSARHPDYAPFYQSALLCAITAVWHLRSKETAHEIIVVQYTLSLLSSSDTRFARFERARIPTIPSRKRTLGGTEELEQFLTTSARLDSLTISDSWQALVEHYDIVQALSAIPAGVMDVLDVLALADVLGDIAHGYSALLHLCQWYAAVFFKLLRERVALSVPFAAVTHERGPAYADAGTARLGRLVVRLVDVESAELVWPVGDATPDDIVRINKAALARFDSPPDRLEDKLRRALAEDTARLRSQLPAFASINEATHKRLPELRQRVQRYTDETARTIELARRARTLAADLQVVQTEIQQAKADTAVQHAEIAELKRQLEFARAGAAAGPSHEGAAYRGQHDGVALAPF